MKRLIKNKCEDRAIIITYTGTEIFDAGVASLVSVVSKYMPEGANANVKVLNSEEIQGALLSVGKRTVQEPETNNEAVEKAIVIIGTRYAEYLVGPDRSATAFNMMITSDLYKGIVTDSEEELRKAVYVIGNNKADVASESELCLKYGLYNDVLNTICNLAAGM